MPEVHPEVAHLAFLLGDWVGAGQGEYPTIGPFDYGEEISFFESGKPWIGYRTRTWDPEDGSPRHSESGFLRPSGPGRVEMVVAHVTGVVEVDEGTVEGTTIRVSSVATARTGTAKEVTGLHRVIEVDGATLRYTLAMAAVGHPMTHHLRAELERSSR